MVTKQLPEARRCVDPEDSFFGAVAVRTSTGPLPWAVMTVANGGHHAREEEVADWTAWED